MSLNATHQRHSDSVGERTSESREGYSENEGVLRDRALNVIYETGIIVTNILIENASGNNTTEKLMSNTKTSLNGNIVKILVEITARLSICFGLLIPLAFEKAAIKWADHC